VIVRTAVNLVGLYGRVSAPIIPFAAEAMRRAVGESSDMWPGVDISAELSRIPEGRALTTPPILFSKIEDTQVAAWSARFGAA
jgi:methionyl-tRNA synthetase